MNHRYGCYHCDRQRSYACLGNRLPSRDSIADMVILDTYRERQKRAPPSRIISHLDGSNYEWVRE
jgi:hypothetical protein